MLSKRNWQYPEHIQIEPINGVCSARCTMCTIENWKRPYRVMPMTEYEEILRRCKTIHNQRFLTLHGLGEPLLDSLLPERVALAKSMGYKGTGFATNCTHLVEATSRALMEAGLDTIICSIDGATKQTHERIRVGTSFDAVVANVRRFLEIRNAEGYQTRVLVRFISQEDNCSEWSAYKDFWESQLDASKNDGVLRFDVHNWGEAQKIQRTKNQTPLHNPTCSDLSKRLYILSTGDLALCCADDNKYFELGNALQEDPLLLYNTGKFEEFRIAMRDGRLLDMFPCSECSIIQSRETRILVDD